MISLLALNGFNTLVKTIQSIIVILDLILFLNSESNEFSSLQKPSIKCLDLYILLRGDPRWEQPAFTLK